MSESRYRALQSFWCPPLKRTVVRGEWITIDDSYAARNETSLKSHKDFLADQEAEADRTLAKATRDYERKKKANEAAKAAAQAAEAAKGEKPEPPRKPTDEEEIIAKCLEPHEILAALKTAMKDENFALAQGLVLGLSKDSTKDQCRAAIDLLGAEQPPSRANAAELSAAMLEAAAALGETGEDETE